MPTLSELSPKALQVLHDAQSPIGTRAAVVPMANYQAVFCRDAVVTGLQGLMEHDSIRSEGLKTSLQTLRNHQGAQGQIPSNVRLEAGQLKVSFGRLSPKIDSVSWYVLGCAKLVQHGESAPGPWVDSMQSAIALLETLEFNGSNLIYIPRGGNWADEYLTEGYTLFDQALRAWSLLEAGRTFNQPDWIRKSNLILDVLTSHYVLESGLFASSLLPGTVDRRMDLVGHCMLAMATEPGTPAVVRALKVISDNTILKGQLPPAFLPVIYPDDPNWSALEGFHLFGMKNKPHHYHNGGIWWIWTAWYAQALRRHGLEAELQSLLELTELVLNSHTDFDFEEYLTSDTLAVGGTPKLCFTATGIRILHFLKNE